MICSMPPCVVLLLPLLVAFVEQPRQESKTSRVLVSLVGLHAAAGHEQLWATSTAGQSGAGCRAAGTGGP
jgi:hypothetical protein